MAGDSAGVPLGVSDGPGAAAGDVRARSTGRVGGGASGCGASGRGASEARRWTAGALPDAGVAVGVPGAAGLGPVGVAAGDA
ncbi:S1 family peptidase, partial [Streptomyces sp. TRM76130]|nr:S1 family peptidase [Streptomyces sp. TRM76130]